MNANCERCRGKCCIGPLINALDYGEVSTILGDSSWHEREAVKTWTEGGKVGWVNLGDFSLVRLKVRVGEKPRYALKANSGSTPCPQLGEDGKCRVYEVRPASCRRYEESSMIIS